jgi:hypothetical protein
MCNRQQHRHQQQVDHVVHPALAGSEQAGLSYHLGTGFGDSRLCSTLNFMSGLGDQDIAQVFNKICVIQSDG